MNDNELVTCRHAVENDIFQLLSMGWTQNAINTLARSREHRNNIIAYIDEKLTRLNEEQRQLLDFLVRSVQEQAAAARGGVRNLETYTRPKNILVFGGPGVGKTHTTSFNDFFTKGRYSALGRGKHSLQDCCRRKTPAE